MFPLTLKINSSLLISAKKFGLVSVLVLVQLEVFASFFTS